MAQADAVLQSSSSLAERGADNDEQCIGLWLHGRAEQTVRAYRADIEAFRAHSPVPLRMIALIDVQSWADALKHLSTASQARKLAAIKSLLSFGHRIGYLPFDVGAPIRLPKVKDTLAERILEEGEVQRMLSLEPNPRNHVLLRLLYGCGLRRSEVSRLCWRDARGSRKGGQLTVFGKGDKTRFVVVSPKLWRLVSAMRGSAGPDDPIFRSREGGQLHPSQVHNIVKAAAARAGLDERASAHWLRHAHASHALDRGAPVHVVQASLGHGSLSTTTRYTHVRPGDGSANYLPE